MKVVLALVLLGLAVTLVNAGDGGKDTILFKMCDKIKGMNESYVANIYFEL